MATGPWNGVVCEGAGRCRYARVVTAPLLPGPAEDDGTPLGLAMASIMLVGFMLVPLLAGVSHLARGGRGMLAGLALVLFGGGMVACGWRLYKRSFTAWAVAVVVLALILVSIVAGAVMKGQFGLLLNVPLFVVPLLLLLLPGTRGAVSRRRVG